MTELKVCAICIDPIEKKNELRLPCSHSYHIECIKMMHKAKCPQCNAPFGAVRKLGKDGLDEIKKREILDQEEQKKVIADEDAIVAAQLMQQDRVMLLNNINQEIAMLQRLLQNNEPPLDEQPDEPEQPEPGEVPDPTPLTEEERVNINNALLMFFEANANELGFGATCEAAHGLVHNMRDNNVLITDCDEIDELIEIVSLAFEFSDLDEEDDGPPPLVDAEYKLNADLGSSNESESMSEEIKEEPQPVNNEYGLTAELSSDDEQNE